MGRVARQPLLSAAQRARERLDGRVIYGSSLQHLPIGRAALRLEVTQAFSKARKVRRCSGAAGLVRERKKQDRSRCRAEGRTDFLKQRAEK